MTWSFRPLGYLLGEACGWLSSGLDSIAWAMPRHVSDEFLLFLSVKITGCGETFRYMLHGNLLSPVLSLKPIRFLPPPIITGPTFQIIRGVGLNPPSEVPWGEKSSFLMQFDFRRSHSITDAMVQLKATICRAFAMKKRSESLLWLREGLSCNM